MALALVERGKRVGVIAQSHRVIANFLEAVANAAHEAGDSVRIVQLARRSGGCIARTRTSNGSRRTRSVSGGLASGEFQVVGGTSWLWARDDMAEAVDVLFVDEAGQLSLATVVLRGRFRCARSSCSATRNQLPQVSQGTHPEGAEASALEHLLDGARTIAPDRGLFLETT